VLNLSDNISLAGVTLTSVSLAFSAAVRLWKFDAGENRTDATARIQSGVNYNAEDLGLNANGTGTTTLFVEAVAGSAASLSIAVNAVIIGDKWSGRLTDMVHVRSVKLASITVSSHTHETRNSTDESDLTESKLFVEADTNDSAIIDIEANGTPENATVGANLLWYIDGKDPSIRAGTFATNPSVTLTIHPSNSQRRLNVTAGFDQNGDGRLTNDEVTHQVNVFLVRFSSVTLSNISEPAPFAEVFADHVIPDSDIAPSNVPTFLLQSRSYDGTSFLRLNAFVELGNSDARRQILWRIYGRDVDGGLSVTGHLGQPTLPTVTLTSGINNKVTQRHYNDIGFDSDADGLLDTQEIDRSAKVVVIPLLDIQIDTFIKSEWVDGPTGFGVIYHGDDRIAVGGAAAFDRNDQRYRTRQKITLMVLADDGNNGDVIAGSPGATYQDAGLSIEYDKASSLTPGGSISAAAIADNILNDGFQKTDLGLASMADSSMTPERKSNNEIEVIFNMSESNPLFGLSPNIDYDFELNIRYDTLGGIYSLSGSHDGFPCYQVSIGNHLAYTHDSGSRTILSLFGLQEFEVDQDEVQVTPLEP